MFWEGYVCKFNYDEDGSICGRTDPIYIDRFETFNDAMKWFKDTIDNHENLARWYVKVYRNKFDEEGDLLCAFSMEWDDPIFNLDAV